MHELEHLVSAFLSVHPLLFPKDTSVVAMVPSYILQGLGTVSDDHARCLQRCLY